MSSFENSNDFDENQKIIPSEMAKELQATISTLKEQLTQEQNKNEELSIQNKNASNIVAKLWDQLHDGVRKLVLTKENFPSDSGNVFESQDHVFVVEFKGFKVLHSSVMTVEQIQEQMRLKPSSGGSL